MRSNGLLAATLILGLLLGSCTGRKSTGSVTQITSPSFVTGITANGKTVWCSTLGGLVKWDIPDGKYTVYTTADGLPSNALSDVVLDGKGRIWVGSDAGIAVQEGSGWKCYDSSQGLPSNTVNDLSLDRDKNVWVSTDKGAASIKGGRPHLLDDKEGPGKSNIACVFFDSGKNMWIGTPKDGVYVKLQGAWRKLGSQSGLIMNAGETIAQNADNSIWVGCWGGMGRWDGQGFQSVNLKKECDTFETREMIATRDKLWFFTANGVHSSRGGDYEHFLQKDGLISNDVTCGYVESDDRVIAGTPYGFSIIEKGVITNYAVPGSPFGKEFVSLTFDGKGRLFAGTRGDGLNVQDSGVWALVPGKTPEMLKTVSSVVFAPDSSIVFNTSDGMVTWRDHSWSVQTRENGLAGNDIRCGLFDREGRYWAGTATGISSLSGGSWTRYRTVHGLPSENVWACAMDSTGTVWFGTDAGIVAFSKNTLTNWTSEAGSDSIDVRSVAVSNGTVYFGTNSGKLIAWDGKSWNSSSRSSKGILAITVDPSGALWLGTDGDGVIRVNGKSVTHYTMADGLPSNRVNAVAVHDNRVLAACYGGMGVITGEARKTP